MDKNSYPGVLSSELQQKYIYRCSVERITATNHIQMFCRANDHKISYIDVLSSELPQYFIKPCSIKRITTKFHTPMFCRANDRNISYTDVLSSELSQNFIYRCSVERIYRCSVELKPNQNRPRTDPQPIISYCCHMIISHHYIIIYKVI